MKKAIVFICALLFLTFVSVPCHAISFKITRLTDNSIWDYPSCTYDGTVAWKGAQINYWDGNSVVNIAAGGYPSLWNGTIAFTRSVLPFGPQVFYWDASNITQITDNSTQVGDQVSLYSGTIAWAAHLFDGNFNIYYWDGNNTTQITNNGKSRFPSLYNGTIAWMELVEPHIPSRGGSIVYWDGNTTMQVSNNCVTTGLTELSLYDGTIAWAGGDPDNLSTWEIYYWDGSSTSQITNNSLIDFAPSVYNGTIVWAGGDPNDQSSWEIYYWDGSNIIQVTNDSIKEDYPHIHNRTIAFTGKIDDTNYEVYVAEPVLSPPVVEPSDGATDVPVGTNITATFSDNIDPTTVDTNSFYISGVAGSVSYDVGTETASFSPAADLDYDTTYTVTITTDVEDLTGNALETDFVWSFTTASPPDITPPTVDSTSPVDGATDVAVNAAVTATFSEAMDASTLTTSTFMIYDGALYKAGTVNYSGLTATFTPTSNFDYDTIYTATITTAAEDLAGNPIQSDYAWTFTTAAAPDTTSPTVDSNNPTAGATGVAADSTITVTFSENMDESTLTGSTFIVNNGFSNIAGAVTCNAATATFTPSNDLDQGTAYTATITTGATDLAANPLQADYNWEFTTQAATSSNGNNDEETGPKAAPLNCFISSVAQDFPVSKLKTVLTLVFGILLILNLKSRRRIN